MRHVPHLHLPGPWEESRLAVDEGHRHHLERVLRLGSGAEVSYTDGIGTVGRGRYLGGEVSRGEEWSVPPPSRLVVVAAAPSSRERAKFMVEKLAELGVAELRFLDSTYAHGRPARRERLQAWARSGLEQSRGAWLLHTSPQTVALHDLALPFAVCHPSGDPDPTSVGTVVVGPEGGWAPGEIPAGARLLGLGPTVLRVETAAIVAASRTMMTLESGIGDS